MMTNKIGTIDEIIKKYGNTQLDITTPIIGIYGSGISTNKYNIQNQIKKEFLDRNYKVSQIIIHKQEKLEFSYDFPFDIFKFYGDDNMQMITFNNYVYEICKVDNPDLLLIEIPYGIVPINRHITNEFGIFAYKVSNSINIDIGIMNLYLDAYNTKFYDEMESLFLYRLSIDTVYFNLHNKALDWVRLRERKAIKLMNVLENDLDIVKAAAKKQNVFILKRDYEFKKLINVIETKLSDNAVACCL